MAARLAGGPMATLELARLQELLTHHANHPSSRHLLPALTLRGLSFTLGARGALRTARTDVARRIVLPVANPSPAIQHAARARRSASIGKFLRRFHHAIRRRPKAACAITSEMRGSGLFPCWTRKASAWWHRGLEELRAAVVAAGHLDALPDAEDC